ncbi:MAG: site-2 protease family protein [Anaerolineae bacterium]
MSRRYLNVGAFAGVPVRLDVSWFVLITLITWALPRLYLTQALPLSAQAYSWVVALLVALLFGGTVLLHELAHATAARAVHLKVKQITLTLFGGGVSLAENRQYPGQELLISLAGPSTTIVSGLLFGLVYHASSPGLMVVAAPARVLQVTCIVLGIFNLLPALPLDGGQALKAVLWYLGGDQHAAARWAARIGQWLGTVLTVGSLMLWFTRDAREWIWVALVGLLVESGARGALRQADVRRALDGRVAADVMLRGCVPLEPTLTLEALDDALARRRVPCLVVGDGDAVYGILTPRLLRKVPRPQWPSTTLAAAMLPLSDEMRAEPELGLDRVLERMEEYRLEEMPVMRDGVLLGVVERHEISRLIESRMAPGLG